MWGLKSLLRCVTLALIQYQQRQLTRVIMNDVAGRGVQVPPAQEERCEGTRGSQNAQRYVPIQPHEVRRRPATRYSPHV